MTPFTRLDDSWPDYEVDRRANARTWTRQSVIALLGSIGMAALVNLMLGLSMLSMGCSRDSTYSPETDNALSLRPLTECAEITLISEEWYAYCVGSAPKAALVVTFTTNGAPADTIFGAVSTHYTSQCIGTWSVCTASKPLEIYHQYDNVYVAVGYPFTFDCISGTGNFERKGYIQARCDGGEWSEILLTCAENGVVILDNPGCGGGHDPDPEEQGGEGHLKTCARYYPCVGTMSCVCTCNQGPKPKLRPMTEDERAYLDTLYGRPPFGY